MRWLLFLSRLDFICIICFLLSLVIRLAGWQGPQDVTGTIGVLGYLGAFALTPFIGVCYAAAGLLKQPLRAAVPLWLILVNSLFCVFEFIYIFTAHA